MKFKDYIDETGKIRVYDLEQELDLLVKLPDSKPSKRIINSKKGIKAIAALKNLNLKHNHSWYKELKCRAQQDLNAIALFYRGNKITFGEMFEEADKLAKSFTKIGIKKGDEIPVCMSNTPELVYIMLAANKIGAKLNIFGNHLNSDYLNTILDGCTSKLFIGSDDVYEKISGVIGERQYDNKLLVSLADSLPEDPASCDEYEPLLDKYYHYDNLVAKFKENDSSIKSFNEFVDFGSDYNEEIIDDNNLDTEFLVTYTSGSTKIGFPSQIIHSNRSLITSGRFHDPVLSGNPEIKGLRGLAHIHPESNTDLITCISDNLMQLWSVGLEPEYGKESFPDYIFINKPNYLNAPTSFFVELAKKHLFDDKYAFYRRMMPFLFAAFAVGEGTSKGEEKLVNKMLRKAKAGSGVKIFGLSLPFTTLCIGGGDCEHGGIYYSLWKAMYEKLYNFRLKRKSYGMMPESYVHVSALKPNDDGSYQECDYNEYGVIVANSSTTMCGYKDNKEKTKSLILTDSLGRDWVSANVYGYVDEIGGVHVKGRIGNEITFSNGLSLPLFEIEEIVQKDTKNILSCSATKVTDDNGFEKIVLNVEFQPDRKMSYSATIRSIFERCKNSFDTELYNMLLVRVIDNENSYPLTGSGKRSVVALENMGITDTLFVNDGDIMKYTNSKVYHYK